MSTFKPCILERKTLPKVWGGRALERVPGIPLPGDDTAVGETWELYDRADGSSRIRGDDATLHDLLVEDPVSLLGRGVRPNREGYFPLLIKYIDATDRLSVQVHPDDEMAAREDAADGGKSEGWVVLDRGEHARIVCGLREGVTRDEFAAVAATSAVEGLLNAFTPEVGQAIYVPAGTVHAIGPDVVLFEIQQNSDITYRLYDWGRPRDTHVEQALRAVRLDAPRSPGAARIDAANEWLFRTPFFTTRRVVINAPVSMGTEGTFKVINVIEGRGTLGWHSGGAEPPLLLGRGDTILVPASVGTTFLSPIGAMTLFVSGPGEAE